MTVTATKPCFAAGGCLRTGLHSNTVHFAHSMRLFWPTNKCLLVRGCIVMACAGSCKLAHQEELLQVAAWLQAVRRLLQHPSFWHWAGHLAPEQPVHGDVS